MKLPLPLLICLAISVPTIIADQEQSDIIKNGQEKSFGDDLLGLAKHFVPELVNKFTTQEPQKNEKPKSNNKGEEGEGEEEDTETNQPQPNFLVSMLTKSLGLSKLKPPPPTKPRPFPKTMPLTTLFNPIMARQFRHFVVHTMRVAHAVFRLAVDIYRWNFDPWMAEYLQPFLRYDVAPALKEFVAPLFVDAIQPLVQAFVNRILWGRNTKKDRGLLGNVLG